MRLAVLGSPIAHSRSPALHLAAYRVLGLDWQYEAIEIRSDELSEFVGSRTPDWRGLSLTMPLKRDVLALLDSHDDFAELTGAANTLLFHHDAGDWTLRGFNTDVAGIAESFRAAGVHRLDSVRILGAGATAASALVAAAELGARRAVVSGRSPHGVLRLIELGERLGVDTVAPPADDSRDAAVPDAVISTLPGGAEHEHRFSDAVRESAVLFDVAYDPWPSRLASAWLELGGLVIPGIEMLVNQALVQVRIFVGGSPDIALPDEPAVASAMRAAVGLPD